MRNPKIPKFHLLKKVALEHLHALFEVWTSGLASTLSTSASFFILYKYIPDPKLS